MNRLLPIVLLLAYFTTAFGQTKKADSLRAVLNQHPQADTFRVNRLNELAAVLVSNPVMYDSVANAALRLAQKIHYPYGQVQALVKLSAHANERRETLAAQQYVEKALQLAQKMGDDKLLLATYMSWNGVNMAITVYQKQIADNLERSRTLAQKMGNYTTLLDIESITTGWYNNQGNYPVALQHALAGLAISQKFAVPIASRISILEIVSGTYALLKDYDQALSFIRRALRLSDTQSLATTDFSKLTTVTNLGYLYAQMHRFAEAETCYLQVLRVKGIPIHLKQYTEMFLATAYEEQGKHTLAFQTAFALLPQFRQIHNEEFFNITNQTLSLAYLHTNRPDSAVFYGMKAFQYAEKTQFKETIQELSEILAQAYAQLHDYSKAYKYLQTFVTYRDSLTFEEFKQKATVARFNEQLSAQKSRVAFLNKTRQLEAQAAHRQQILLYFILGCLLLLAVLAYVLFRNNQQKQQANRLLNHQKQQIERTLTELHATQAQLIQKEKLASLGELTAGIAHEIQNPLNFVNNFSEVSAELATELTEELDKGEVEEAKALATDLSSNLRKIHHHGQRASSIVKGMLEHSRTESGDKQPTNLNALADEYLKIAYHGQRANNKSFNCELTTDFDATIGKVAIIPQDIGRVLLNLYNNAFYAVWERAKSLPNGYQPTVQISTKQVGNGVEIRVLDNGTGIPESVKAKIFQPFFTTKPTGEGTGLGLSLSYDIVTKGHVGTITVESTEGEGTEFIITLPTTV